MKRISSFLIVMCLSSLAFAARVEIRNNRFYVDGEPFYMRAVSYSSLRPNQRPDASYSSVNYKLIDQDFARIKAAHFNTVRSFDALSAEELELAKKHQLMVLQGVWIDRQLDYGEPHNLEAAVGAVQRMAERSKDFDNVLGYLVMSKPQASAVLAAGIPETLQFYRRLKRSIQTIDPRPVSLDSWLPLAFLDHTDSDFLTFSAFAFWPRYINEAIGYPLHVRWLVDRFGKDKPVLIGATGGYAVSKATSSAEGGVGGLTEYNQSLRNLESLRGTLEGHAAGAVLVTWLDSWQAAGEPEVHNDDPWEWNGVLAVPTDRRTDQLGVPRRLFRDVQAYNQILFVEPRANHFYPVEKLHPIEIFGADNISGIRFSLNDGDYTPLKASGHGYFSGFFKLDKLARRRQKMTIQGLDVNHAVVMEKDLSFLAAISPETVTIESTPEGGAGKLSFTVKALDGGGKPLANRKINFGFFLPVTMRETGGTQTTNATGEVTLTCSLALKKDDRFLLLAAGTRSPDRVTAGDMRLFALGN